MTHTSVILEVSSKTYREIRAKLKAAGYDHVFGEDEGKEIMEMNQIALKRERK